MIKMRGNVTLTDEGRFEVLGLVSIATPGPWRWHTEDLNVEGAKGAIFRCYEENADREPAYLIVADVSDDPEELDISVLEQRHVHAVDQMLEQRVRRNMAVEGREMIRWTASHLNENSGSKTLVTAYIARDNGIERQYLDVRKSVRGVKTVLAGCFNVDRADEFSQPIFWALNDARVLSSVRDSYNSR